MSNAIENHNCTLSSNNNFGYIGTSRITRQTIASVKYTAGQGLTLIIKDDNKEIYKSRVEYCPKCGLKNIN